MALSSGAMERVSLALAFCLFAPLVACGEGGEPSVDGLALPVDAEGPFQVGHRAWETTYTPPAGGAERTIPVLVWYPTRDEQDLTGDPPTRFPTYSGLFADRDTIVDATAAAPSYQGTYPVIVYSHGHQGVAGGSFRLLRYFASHGWVALSVGHVGNQLTDRDGTITPLTHWIDRPLDVSAGLDALEALPADDALSAAETSRVLITGHSRGSYTPWAIAGASFDMPLLRSRCAEGDFSEPCTDAQLAVFEAGFRDPRFVAGMPTAGDGHREFFDGVMGMDDATIPMFQMTAEADGRGVDDLFAFLSDGLDYRWIEFAEGCHELFNLGCDAEQNMLGFPAVATYALAWGRVQVLDDTTPNVVGIVDGAVEVTGRVTFLRK